MSSFRGSPRLIKGGLVILDAVSGTVKRTIALQYNPDTLTRSYQVQGAGGDGGAERAQPFRLKGPAIESIKLEAEIDATDSLEHPDQPGRVHSMHQTMVNMMNDGIVTNINKNNWLGVGT